MLRIIVASTMFTAAFGQVDPVDCSLVKCADTPVCENGFHPVKATGACCETCQICEMPACAAPPQGCNYVCIFDLHLESFLAKSQTLSKSFFLFTCCRSKARLFQISAQVF